MVNFETFAARGERERDNAENLSRDRDVLSECGGIFLLVRARGGMDICVYAVVAGNLEFPRGF